MSRFSHRSLFALCVVFMMVLAVAFNGYAQDKKPAAPPAAGEKQATPVETADKAATVHYKYVDFATALDSLTLQDFGDQVDQALKEADSQQLSALAMVLYLAEKSSGKTAKELSAAQLLKKAADLAEVQQNKTALNVVGAALEIVGDAAGGANYKKLAANVKERADSRRFDLCVDNWDNDHYDIFVDGRHAGSVGPLGKSCGENVGGIGTTRLVAIGWKNTLTGGFVAEAYSSYTWKLSSK